MVGHDIKYRVQYGNAEPLRYGPVAGTLEKKPSPYFHCPDCEAPSPLGYFATMRGIKQHRNFVHGV